MATLTETFTNIADAIRSKTETTDKITPENMPAMIEGITTGGNVMELSITSNGTYRAPEGIDGYTPVIVNVPQDGSPSAEALKIKGVGNYRFAFDNWNWFIEQYGNQITTENIIVAESMFAQSPSILEIPFDLNFDKENGAVIQSIFVNSGISKCPKMTGKITNTNMMFGGCENLEELNDDFYNEIDWSFFDNIPADNHWDGNRSQMFWCCRNLKKMPPIEFLNHGSRETWGSNTIYWCGFQYCNNLEEIVDMPIPHYFIEGTDGLDGFVEECYKLRKLTFALGEDGNPQMVKWGGLVLYLNRNTGWEGDNSNSVYDLQSAIETIHSLPDATNAINDGMDMNTIVFSSTAGANNRGAIGDMSEEDIALAAAKGWTVAFE